MKLFELIVYHQMKVLQVLVYKIKYSNILTNEKSIIISFYFNYINLLYI